MTKLTAKLSDGREYEIASEWHAKEDGYVFLCLKPAQKKPREWWVVKDTEWPNMWCFFNTKDEALEHVKANQLYRTGPFLAREVVE